jgi:hypothetical protein
MIVWVPTLSAIKCQALGKQRDIWFPHLGQSLPNVLSMGLVGSKEEGLPQIQMWETSCKVYKQPLWAPCNLEISIGPKEPNFKGGPA